MGSTFNGAIAKYLHVEAIKLSQRKRVLLGMWKMYWRIHLSLKGKYLNHFFESSTFEWKTNRKIKSEERVLLGMWENTSQF